MSHYRFTLPSMVEECCRLRQCIGVVSRIEGYDESFASSLELSVHEAFVNAARHGNHDDPSLTVVVSFRTTDRPCVGRSLEVRIQDWGEGFDPAPFIADASSEQALSRTGGRGLYLISHFAESLGVERLSVGCVVVLRYIPY